MAKMGKMAEDNEQSKVSRINFEKNVVLTLFGLSLLWLGLAVGPRGIQIFRSRGLKQITVGSEWVKPLV